VDVGEVNETTPRGHGCDARREECPRCGTALGDGARTGCGCCGLAFERPAARAVIDVLAGTARERDAAEVERFYTASPFPGYAPEDDGPALLVRSRRSAFLHALDTAIAPAARVLDIGAGTGQLAAFLALAGPRRRVVAVDGCRAPLALAEGFKRRVGLENLHLVRADLFALPLPVRAFEVVVSRGVVHHTPDPKRATEAVAARVAPGGVLVLGFYESWARLVHRARRGLGRVVGRPIAALDPVLRRADLDAEKRRIWIEDQYHHPLERSLAAPEVEAWLRAEGFEILRTVPPSPPHGGLFAEAAPAGRVAAFTRRARWAAAGPFDPDAGLVCIVARRRSNA
jgi:SAM-dependent methyltransferase